MHFAFLQIKIAWILIFLTDFPWLTFLPSNFFLFRILQDSLKNRYNYIFPCFSAHCWETCGHSLSTVHEPRFLMDSILFVHTASLPCLWFDLLLASGWNFLHLSPTDWSFILRSNITSFYHWLHSLDMNSITLDFLFVVVPSHTAMSPILSFLRSETMTRSSCVVSLKPTKRWHCQFPRMYMGFYYFLCAVLLNCFRPIQYFLCSTQHMLIWIWIHVQSNLMYFKITHRFYSVVNYIFVKSHAISISDLTLSSSWEFQSHENILLNDPRIGTTSCPCFLSTQHSYGHLERGILN